MNHSEDKRDENFDEVEFESYNDEGLDGIEETDEEGLELSSAEKLKRLKKKLRDCDKERIENLTGWQRAKADFVNLKKRSAEDTERQILSARQSIIETFFPVIDSLEAAMKDKAWEDASDSWRSGVESIFKQFVSALKSVGVTEIDCLGKDFDPHLHTSVAIKETDDKNKDNIISEVIQKGYIFSSGEVIRSPKVVVFHFNG